MSENDDLQIDDSDFFESRPESPKNSEVESTQAGVDEILEGIVEEQDLAASQDAQGSLQSQLDEANDKVLKLHAELDNVRRRVRREADEQIRYASLPLMQDLLGVLDNLRRGIDAARKSDSADGLLDGVEMVAKQFEDTLGKFSCNPIPAVGEVFDPNVHEAISQMPSNDVEKGHVLMQATQGFQLHERVVRPSQVVVSTGKAEG